MKRKIFKQRITNLGRRIADDAIELPFESAQKKLQRLLLIFNIIMLSAQFAMAVITMSMAYVDAQWVQAITLSVVNFAYVVLIVLYILFHVIDNHREEKGLPATFWSAFRTSLLKVMRFMIAVLSIVTSITLIIIKNSNQVFDIIVLVFSIINLVVNGFLLVLQIYGFIRSLIMKKMYGFERERKDLNKEKRRLLFAYFQQQLREYRAYSKKLDDQYAKHFQKLDRASHDEQLPEGADSMPILAQLEDDQYEFTSINKTRIVVRGIVLNREGKIALNKIFTTKGIFGPRDYYELPGGGVQAGETLEGALKREIEEETGQKISVIKGLGRVDDRYNLIQQENHNYFYLCEATGPGIQRLEAYESEMIQKVVWVSFKKAIQLYEKGPDYLVGRLVKNRELPIIRLAQHEISHLKINN